MDGKLKRALRSTTLGLALSAIVVPSLAQTPPPGNPPRGFQQPGTPFGGSNPFAGKPPGAGRPGEELFEEDEFDEDFENEEVDDISDEILRQRMEQRLRERAQGAPPIGGSRDMDRDPPRRSNGVDFGATASAMGNTSTAPGANARITPGDKSSGCLKLDPFTGYGPDVITNFDFPDADIVEIAKTLGRLTCLNFILEKDVKGRISVVSNNSITVGDAWKAFLTSLDVNGFTIIPSGKYLRIARQRDAKDKQIKTYSGEFAPDTDLFITRVLPLKYINAEETARVFRNFMPPNTRIISYDQTNTLIISDTGSNIKKIVDMVQLLDVEGYDEGLEVIRIRFASAQDIAKLIDQLLPGQAGGAPGQPPGGIPRFRSGGGFASRKTKEGGVISHVIPDERTNSVIISANAKGLDQVKELIRKLDSKVTASQGGSRIHVVYLQFADAEQVAQTLNNLASGGGAARPASPTGNLGAPPATTAQLFEGAIKISADKPTNSLVITGTPADFQTVSRVIAKLDVPRDQVYVEAIIMEMTLDKQFELGTSVALPNSGIGFFPDTNFANFLLNPFSLQGVVMGFQAGNSSRSIDVGNGRTISVKSVQGLVRALQQNTNSNVLATPQILTLDNQEASIEISENIPIPTSTAVQGAGIQQSITREKIALKLQIKPQINKISNFVKLDIKQQLEDISSRTPPKGVADLAFATTGRSSQTTVVVQDGDTVAMGGLVRDKVTEVSNKVPLLGDIPVLGWLFRSKTTASTKQNLLVFITPQIIKQYQNVRKILDKKIRQRDEFIERNAGGDDVHQAYKLDMIKNLPAVSELRNGGRVENADLEPAEDNLMDSIPERIIPPASNPAPLRGNQSGFDAQQGLINGQTAPMQAPPVPGAVISQPPVGNVPAQPGTPPAAAPLNATPTQPLDGGGATSVSPNGLQVQ